MLTDGKPEKMRAKCIRGTQAYANALCADGFHIVDGRVVRLDEGKGDDDLARDELSH